MFRNVELQLNLILPYEASMEGSWQLIFEGPGATENDYTVDIFIDGLQGTFYISDVNSHLEALWQAWLEYRVSTYPQVDIIAAWVYGFCKTSDCTFSGEVHTHVYHPPFPTSE